MDCLIYQIERGEYDLEPAAEKPIPDISFKDIWIVNACR